MTVEETIELVKKLDWNLSLEVQKAAFDELMKGELDNVSVIIQPYMKPTWENAVKLIDELGYPKNKEALPQLIWLLSDINWPGALKAIDILKTIDKNVLEPLIIDAIDKAYKEQDTMWIAGINRLIIESGLQELFADESICSKLAIADF